MSAIKKPVVVTEARTLQISTPDLEPGEKVWVTIEREADQLAAQQRWEEFRALVVETQALPGVSDVTEADIRQAIEEVRRESR